LLVRFLALHGELLKLRFDIAESTACKGNTVTWAMSDQPLPRSDASFWQLTLVKAATAHEFDQHGRSRANANDAPLVQFWAGTWCSQPCSEYRSAPVVFRVPKPGGSDLEYRRQGQSRMNAVHTELFLLCLIASLATIVALGRKDPFFSALFATASLLAFGLALRSGGQN
jgi:hypothetical protein